jgi:hypothetical protein
LGPLVGLPFCCRLAGRMTVVGSSFRS